MKYYLETNALRSISIEFLKKTKVLKSSYTSIFSLFEILKGINRSNDNQRRINLLNRLSEVELGLIDFMPGEIIQGAFQDPVSTFDSAVISDAIPRLLKNQDMLSDELTTIIERYENLDKEFQKRLSIENCIPAPEPKTIKLDLNSLFLDDTPLPSPQQPKDWHPAYYFIDHIKSQYAISLYKPTPQAKDENQDESAIMTRYNEKLNLFFFALHSYLLRRKSLREASSKNDLLDILHTAYLFDYNTTIVTNDKLFDSIVPSRNLISIEEYKQRILQAE
jgi:hypothetical protein